MNSSTSSNVFRLDRTPEPFFSPEREYAERRAVAIKQIDECINGCVQFLGIVDDRSVSLNLKLDRALIAEICAALSRLDLAVSELKEKKL